MSDAKIVFCSKVNTEIAGSERAKDTERDRDSQRERARERRWLGEMIKKHSDRKDAEKFQRKSSPLFKY